MLKKKSEVPVGAVIVLENKIISKGYNCPILKHDPCAHAEIIALRKACQKQQNYRLLGATLYVTLEPCMMCLSALIHARIARIVFGALDPKAGAVRYTPHRLAYTGGVLAEACSSQLKTFFQHKRLKF